MLFTQWLNELTDRVLRKRTGKFARKVRRVSRKATQQSSEVLECRVLPTILVNIDAGNAVTFTTADSVANTLNVSNDGAQYTFTSSVGDNFVVTQDGASTVVVGGGANILTLDNSVTALDINLGAGNDRVVVASLDGIGITVDGGTGSGDVIQGPDAVATAWAIGAANSLDVSGQTVTFSNFDTAQGGDGDETFTIDGATTLNVKGGLGADTFNLETGADLTGSISGEDGVDVLQGTAVDNVTLTSFSATGLGVSGTENSINGGGFSGINSLIGSGAGASLTGIGVTSRWTLDGTAPTYATVVNGVVTNSLPITGFSSLHGGSAVDTFNVTGINSFDLDGGAGNDVINIGTRVGAVITTGQLFGTAIGGTGNDTLDAQNSDREVVLDGGDGNDVVIGTTLNDELTGGLGADRLYGLAGDDILTGGAGNDLLDGGADTDRVLEDEVSSATVTNTRITGGKGTDTLVGIEEVVLNGTAGNNVLDASAYTVGSVTLNGGDGNDTLSGGSNAVLNGQGGNDVVRMTASGTVIIVDGDIDSEGISVTGSSGDDNIDFSGFTGSVTISGGAGNDTIRGGSGNDLLNGMSGNDVIEGNAGLDSILGGAGNDDLDGGTENDRVNGNDGDDTITGGAGDDIITGDGGKDTINGDAGDDKIDGGAGNDSLFGDADNDSISGGAGLDSIEGNAGNDTLNGNADNDRIEGGDGDDKIFGGAGNDVMLGGLGNDEINSQGGNDTMLGEDGDDKLNGGAGNELMFGGDGNDSMNGMAGNDTMLGDDGDDTILGGAGLDLCLGGLGGDDYIDGQGNGQGKPQPNRRAGKDTVAGGGDQDTVVAATGERDEAHHDDFYSKFDSTVFLD